jgi:hypothetical protein
MKLEKIGFNAVNKPITLTDNRKIHQHVIGSSGSGKSKFLELMMRGDLNFGQGFCLIDPHGTLYNDILNYCAYKVIDREIILLNLSEPNHIVGFNFFTKTAGDTSVQVDNLISATLHAWNAENADNTPTLERILKLIFTTVLDADLTLPEVAELLDFEAKEFRQDAISKIENELIKREWQEVSNLAKAKDFRDEMLSAKNRLFRLLTSNTLNRFLGIKNKTIDLVEAMNEGKIILVNLAQSENLSRENARVFGSLLVNQFFQSALQRRKAFESEPLPYYLYLDEFQNFVSLDLCNMLDEIRKFALFLILSHQRFLQLDENITDAILTNCRIKTVFGGLRASDAKMMAEEMFIDKLDPMKIKASIYQTKHWYRYERDKVYSKSTSYSEGEGYSSGEGFGSTSGLSSADVSGSVSLPASDEFFTGANFLGTPDIASFSESHSSGFSDVSSNSSFSGENHSTSQSESEGVADVPIFIPVPFKELTSVERYTIEEQLLELTQALKLQLQRHCFIQLPGQETQPLLVPFVKQHYVSKENYKWYIERIARANNALTPKEADELIAQNGQDLLQLKAPAETTEIAPDKKPKDKKPTIFDELLKQNPKLKL